MRSSLRWRVLLALSLAAVIPTVVVGVLAILRARHDVENEVNGYLTYDRKMMKPDLRIVADRNRAVIAAGSR